MPQQCVKIADIGGAVADVHRGAGVRRTAGCDSGPFPLGVRRQLRCWAVVWWVTLPSGSIDILAS